MKVIAIILLVTLSACSPVCPSDINTYSAVAAASSPQDNLSRQTAEGIDSEPLETAGNIDKILEMFHFVLEDSATFSKIDIQYPQYSNMGLSSNGTIDNINAILRRQALEPLYHYGDIDELLYAGLHNVATCNMMLNDGEYISVKFEGDTYLKETGHPHVYSYCMTLDRKTGRHMTLDDFISREDVKNAFLSDCYEVKSDYFGEVIGTVLSMEDAYEAFYEFYQNPPKDEAYLFQSLCYTSFYITEKSVGLKIGIGDAESNYLYIEIPRK